MRVEKRAGYRVVRGGPVPPQADAITLGRTIIVRERAADHPGLLAHELVHVRQFRALGVPRFMLRYIGSYLRFRLGGFGHMASYRRIPLEVEASWLSRLHSVAELEPEPSAARLRRRLKPGRQSRRAVSPADPRPVPVGGTWNRSRKPLSVALTPAALAARLQAAATSSRDATAGRAVTPGRPANA